MNLKKAPVCAGFRCLLFGRAAAQPRSSRRNSFRRAGGASASPAFLFVLFYFLSSLWERNATCAATSDLPAGSQQCRPVLPSCTSLGSAASARRCRRGTARIHSAALPRRLSLSRSLGSTELEPPCRGAESAPAHAAGTRRYRNLGMNRAQSARGECVSGRL